MQTDRPSKLGVKVIAKYHSKSKPGEVHTVTLSKLTGYVFCSCPGFHYRGECRHKEDQIERLARSYSIVPIPSDGREQKKPQPAKSHPLTKKRVGRP
jgi:hypothetical protein